MSLTSSPLSLLIKCPYHLSHASLTFSAMSTTSHLLISSFHNVSDQLSFISSYYMSIPSQPCFPHLLCNVYHLTSSDLFNEGSNPTFASPSISSSLFGKITQFGRAYFFCFHRSVGGLRVSLYNAVMLHEVEHFIEFMKHFQEKHSK